MKADNLRFDVGDLVTCTPKYWNYNLAELAQDKLIEIELLRDLSNSEFEHVDYISGLNIRNYTVLILCGFQKNDVVCYKLDHQTYHLHSLAIGFGCGFGCGFGLGHGLGLGHGFGRGHGLGHGLGRGHGLVDSNNTTQISDAKPAIESSGNKYYADLYKWSEFKQIFEDSKQKYCLFDCLVYVSDRIEPIRTMVPWFDMDGKLNCNDH